MSIIIKNKKCKRENILKEYPDCIIFDVTSKGDMKELSPFFPHNDIPVPFSTFKASCVEGIWQGLKVFETEGVSLSTFRNGSMKNIKRTCRTHGKCLGHKKLDTGELLDYIEARKQIYVPSYFWMLENKCRKYINILSKLSKERTVVLLDYDTNEDIENPSKPLSHASLIKRYVIESEKL